MSVIPISTELEKSSQSDLFKLYHLLKRITCCEDAAFILIAMGLYCDLGITSKTSFSH